MASHPANTTSMRAAQCDAPGAPLVVRDVPMPVPAPGELLVRLESCGVCHSDLHLRDGHESLPPSRYPLTLGHEGIGRVVAHGDERVARFPLGSRVALPWLHDSCLDCRACLGGNETFCPAQRARGVDVPGAFAEYALLDVRFACAVPEKIDPIAAAPLLCAGLTAWSALERSRLRAGANVLIVGAGGLGQYALMIARARGADVFVVDTDPAKLALALELGATAAFAAGLDAGRAVKAAGGADVTLNLAPTATSWSTIEAAVNPMSDVVAVALVHEPVPLSMMWLIDGGHRVFGSSVGTRRQLRDLLAFDARHPLRAPVESIALDDVDDALERLKAGDVRGRLCIDFSR